MWQGIQYKTLSALFWVSSAFYSHMVLSVCFISSKAMFYIAEMCSFSFFFLNLPIPNTINLIEKLLAECIFSICNFMLLFQILIFQAKDQERLRVLTDEIQLLKRCLSKMPHLSADWDALSDANTPDTLSVSGHLTISGKLFNLWGPPIDVR